MRINPLIEMFLWDWDCWWHFRSYILRHHTSHITQHWLSHCHLSQGFISLDTITNPEIILLCPSLDSNKAWVRYFFAKVLYCCHQHSCCLNIEHILFLSMSGSPMSPGCISPLSVTPMMTGDVSVMSWTIVAGEEKSIKSKAKISHCQSPYCCYYCQHSTKKATHWPCSMCWCILQLHHLPPILDDCYPW